MVLDTISRETLQKVFIKSGKTSAWTMMNFMFEHLEMELDTHIWTPSRVHEYYKYTKYEPPTPKTQKVTSEKSFFFHFVTRSLIDENRENAYR